MTDAPTAPDLAPDLVHGQAQGHPKAIDLLVNAAAIVPVEPAGAVLHDHALAVDGGRIVGILPSAEAARRYAPRQVCERAQHVLLPGLVNTHTHAAMSLLRGLADDLPLMDWLQNHIWPAEGRHVSREFCVDGVGLAVAESIRGGVTCLQDMYFFPDATAEVCSAAGMRAAINLIVIDFPTAWAGTADEYFAKGLALRDKYKQSDLISIAFGPHAPYTVSDEPLRKAVALSEATGAPIQIHLHETAFEVADAMEKSGKRPTARLAELKVLGTNTQCVHMTQIDESDVSLLKQSGAHVIHCPESNLKLASGLCPVQDLLDNGINVAIGTDGAASNNDLDLFGELRTAAMVAKVVAGDASALSAHKALEMATINGARALGRDHELGSLVEGKLADIIAIDLSDPFLQPVYDPASHLVYSNHGRSVSHSWINGVPQVQDGRLTRIDVADLMLRVEDWAGRIRTKAD